jgi:hypothetical protein
MKLTLDRDVFGKEWTQGKLYVDGVFFCYTLEDTDRWMEIGGDKVYSKTAIPRGEYQLKLTHSPRFKKVLPLLLDVPQFTGIRIHAGNSHVDTDGCILVGMERSENGMVLQSKVAMVRLMDLLENTKEPVTIEVA